MKFTRLATTFTQTLVAASLIALGACSREAPPGPEAPSESNRNLALGRSVFETPLEDGNSFSCATCHALSEPSADGLRRAGHPIGDATRRHSWKNGKSATFLDAVNSCLEEWMVAPSWSATDPNFLALRDFLDAQAPAKSAPDLAFQIVPPPADVSGGDVRRGRATFDKTCALCHGAGGLGTDLGPKVARSIRAPDYIAKRIRTSGSAKSAVYGQLTGGVMPFWAKDRLDDREVRDLVAYLRDNPAPTPDADGGVAMGDAGGAGDGGAPTDAQTDATAMGPRDGAPPSPSDAGPPASGCGKTHPRVGWVADLGINTGEGQVSGFVTMIDDCTLELTKFSYDGNGIDVRVFGSKVKNFRPGFIIGPNIVNRRFVKETWRVKLPADKTLDDLDFVSIWCTKARADFGSGPFLPP